MYYPTLQMYLLIYPIFYSKTLVFFVLVPDNTSTEMRHIVQSLLIAYAEPKLNITIQHNDTDLQWKSNFDHTYWCQHLIHPRLLSSSS
jgi:hypothetical protein